MKTQSFPENLLPEWKSLLGSESQKDYFKKLSTFLQNEKKLKKQIFPAQENVLRALKELDYSQVRVVILGQDPYHGENQAIGRSFAVPDSLMPKPPSLKNIFKEITSDLGEKITQASSELSGWVEQGVLLLNTVLTVRSGEAFSHRQKGWEIFTDKVIAELGAREKPLVFILWGAAAQSKKSLIKNPKHYIIESAHPSPLSAHRGFFGSKPFSKANQFLVEKLHEAPIDWTKTRH